jgi:hypothetical protein
MPWVAFLPMMLSRAAVTVVIRLQAAKSTNLEREDFEFYLHAFLSAGRSVTFALQYEVKQEGYRSKFEAWQKTLSDEDQQLLNFFVGQRNVALKRGNADVEAQIEMVPMTVVEMGLGTDPRYSISWVGETEVPQIGRKVHYFEHATGKQVLSTCTRYFKLLESCVREFDPDFEYPIY